MSVHAAPDTDVRETVHAAARRARKAARALGSLTTIVKDRALHAAADAVLAHTHQILAANAEDTSISESRPNPISAVEDARVPAARATAASMTL